MKMSNLIITHYLYCVLRSLEEVLSYDDDLVAMLCLDFTVGISPDQCFLFCLFFSLHFFLTVFSLMID